MGHRRGSAGKSSITQIRKGNSMNRAPRKIVLSLVTVIVFMVAACGGTTATTAAFTTTTSGGTETTAAPTTTSGVPETTAGTGEGYKLGFVASLSGPGSVFADQGIQSAELAIAQITEEGTVNGAIELITADDAGDPRTSDEVCNRLINEDGVDAIIGFQNSANREGCLPVATRAGVPYLYATPYEGGECAPNFFVLGEVPVQQVAPLVEYMVQEQGSSSWFLTGSDYVAMRGGNEFARGVLDETGAEILGEEYAPLGTTDFAPLIDNILRSGANTAFVSFLGTDFIAFLQQWSETPGTSDVKAATFGIPIGAADETVNDLYTAFSYFPSIESDANQRYIDGLQDMFGAEAQTPSILSVVNYDAVWLWALAVQSAGSADGAAVNQALKEVTFDGPRGPVVFNDQGHPNLPMYVAILNDEPLKGTETIIGELPPADPGDQADDDCSQ
jgi:urea transport system substrate-binding protein